MNRLDEVTMECKHEWETWKSSKRCVLCGKKDEHWGVEHAQGGAARGLEKKMGETTA